MSAERQVSRLGDWFERGIVEYFPKKLDGAPPEDKGYQVDFEFQTASKLTFFLQRYLTGDAQNVGPSNFEQFRKYALSILSRGTTDSIAQFAFEGLIPDAFKMRKMRAFAGPILSSEKQISERGVAILQGNNDFVVVPNSWVKKQMRDEVVSNFTKMLGEKVGIHCWE